MPKRAQSPPGNRPRELTKWNRQNRALRKAHWVDAACCGRSTPKRLSLEMVQPWLIRATAEADGYIYRSGGASPSYIHAEAPAPRPGEQHIGPMQASAEMEEDMTGVRG